MKKRFLSILLTLVMVIGMLPMASLTAHAEGSGDDCYIMINGTKIDDLNVAASGSGTAGTWTYTPGTTPTIKLDNYQGGKIHLYDPTPEDGVYSTVKLRIDVNGDCEINNNSNYGISLETDYTTFNKGEERGVGSGLFINFSNNASLTINSPRGIGNVSFNPETYIQGSANLNINATNIGIMAAGSHVTESSGAGTIDKLYGGNIYIDNGLILDVKAPIPFTNGPESPSKLIVDNGAMVLMTSTTDEDFIHVGTGLLYEIPADYTAYKNAKESILQLYKLTVVSEVGVKDITVPAVGKTPDYTATACGNGYEIKNIVWSYYDETISNEDLRWVTMNSGDTFEPGEKYLCTVEVVPSWYATFPDAQADLSAEFNDENANISPVYDASKAYVEKEFTAPHMYIDQPDDVSVKVNKKAPVTFTFSDGAKFGCVEYEESEGVWKNLSTFDHTAITANTAATIEIPAKDTAQILNCRIKLQATSDSKVYISDEFTVEWTADPYIDHPDDVSVKVNEKAPVSFTFSDGAKFGCVEYEKNEGVWINLYTFDHTAVEANKAVTIEIPAKDTAQTLNCRIKLQATSDSEIYISDEFTVEWENKAVEQPFVDYITISDVIAPVAGADTSIAPNYVVDSAANYTVEKAEWWLNNSDSKATEFVAGTNYRAVFTVIPKEGVVFDSPLTVKINGKYAQGISSSEDEVVVSISLTATGTSVEQPFVDYITISDVIAPVAGADTSIAPNYVVDSAANYTVEKAEWWLNNSDSKATEFVAGTNYRAVFTVIPKEGVVFDSPLTVKINGKYAQGISSSEDEVVVSISLTATGAPVVPVTYTITFDANGGTGTMTAATVESDAEYTLPANGFTAPAGKQFKAWSVNGVEKAVGAKITVTANTTVKAVWENIPVTYYTVTFDSNGGSAVAAQTIAAGQKAAKPADPVKNGYIFKGWNLDGSAYNFNAAVNGNITLVAVWEEDNSFMDDWYWALIMLHSQKFDITATASEGGEIAPEGVTKVQYSKNITYTITPDAGYAIKAVFVDGKDVGAVSEYTFKNVTKKHTIHALFEQINPYTDVKAGDWFYDDVLYVTAIGLMEGTGNGKFSPEITTDRAMLVTVLWRLEGCPVVDSSVDFDDVADGLWYSDAIDWASANGIVNGYGNGKFGPTDQITREQIAAILNRYAAYKGWTDGTALPMLSQYKCSEWAEDNVIWAENNGLLDGLGVDVSDMTAKASRAELAAYLAKFYKEFAEN